MSKSSLLPDVYRWVTNEGKDEALDLSSDGNWLTYASGDFHWQSLDSLVLSIGKVTVNQCKVVLSHHLYSVTKPFHSDDGLSFSGMTVSPLRGEVGVTEC